MAGNGWTWPKLAILAGIAKNDWKCLEISDTAKKTENGGKLAGNGWNG